MTIRDLHRLRGTLVCMLFLALGSYAFGSAWTSSGPLYKTIKVVNVSPQHQNVIFAGAFGSGIFKSTDAGATWANYKAGMVNLYVRSLLVLSDLTIYAGTNDGISKTTDGGQNWVSVLTTPNSVRSVAIDPSTNSIYGASFGSGLYKSTNAGTTWSHITVNDPSTGQTLSHLWVVVNFGRDSLYVGGSILDIPQGFGGALFRTVDGGNSWFQMQYPVAIRSSIHSIALSPTAPKTAFILGTAVKGVYLSTDAGTTFSNIDGDGTAHPLPDLFINTVGFMNSMYYTGTDSLGQLYYRPVSDVSNGWTAGTGLPGNPSMINSVNFNQSNSNTMYAGTDGQGVYQSSNSGVSWQAMNSGMLGTAGRAIARMVNGTILLGTDFGDGMWKSTDSAKSWTRIDSLYTSDALTSFGLTSDPSILYVGSYGGGVHKSTDGGLVWRVTDSTSLNLQVRPIEVDPTNLNTVYAGTNDGAYKTTNGGSSWFHANTGMPANLAIRSMDLVNSNPNVIFAGSDLSYLYKSTNGGASWTNITSANGFLSQDVSIRSITVNQSFPNIVYVGADSGRIYKSVNNGSSWSLLFDLPTVSSVRKVLMHPSNNSILFAATFGGGVFVSIDSGSHWAPMNSGLSDQSIYTLEGDQNNPLNLYAGSSATGVFHSTYTLSEHPPVLEPIGNKFALTGKQMALTVSATDSDFTIPTLSAHNLPSGASFFDSANGNGVFSWIPAPSQIGNHSVTFVASDGVAADSETITITVIDSTGAVVVDVPVEVRWNMVSVPIIVNDYRRTTLFPTAITSAYAYNGGYVVRDTLQNGTGYWLKFPSNQTVSMGGGKITQDTITLRPGWNLIGASVSSSISLSRVHPVAPLMITSQFYGYASRTGYVVVDTLRPGKGYWVKVNQSGKVVLSSSPTQIAKAEEPSNTVRFPSISSSLIHMNKLTLTDGEGKYRELFFTGTSISIDPQQFEFPPVPPPGDFDVRFSTQSSLAVVSGHASPQMFPINISSGGKELLIQWNIVETDRSFDIEIIAAHGLSRKLHLQGEGSNVIHDEIVAAKLIAQTDGVRGVPSTIMLDQNYPNPFNPLTVVHYYLPRSARVELKIFNLLGQEIIQLVNGEEGAGDHAVRWEGTGVSNGIYFYQLKVFDSAHGRLEFQEVKKMILLK